MSDPVDREAVEMWISGLGDILLEQKDAEITALRAEIERLRAALVRQQRPEGETLEGIVKWIREEPGRLTKARALLRTPGKKRGFTWPKGAPEDGR